MSARSSARPDPGPSNDRSSADSPFTVQFGPDVPPVRRSPTALARRFYQMCVGMRAEGLDAADITPLEYGAMALLNRKDGEPGVDQNALAARLGVDRSHVSLVVEELGAKGLVERRVNGADRRARLLYLTAKAEKLYWRLRPGVATADRRVLEPLSLSERQTFVDMLIRMIGANGTYARPGAGRRKRSPPQSPSRPTGKAPSHKA
jgi:DNA-binding MarR family transcriptional regulator